MKKVKLSAKIDHRKSLIKNLVTSLILYEKITTSLAKAKAIKPIVEKLVNTAKKGDLNSKRQLFAFLSDKNAALKILEEISKRYQNRSGGYVQIFRLKPRMGDSSQQALIRFIPTKITNQEAKEDKNDQAKAKAKTNV